MNVEQFQKKILSFYKNNKREFPWRNTTNPYKIWISEVMLQQTQTTRVTPKYEAWLQRFPTIKKLSKANLGEVLKYWDGLGYNNRAKWLRDAAKKIMLEHEGKLPIKTKKLEKLPGIGPYTSRAIRIFAHNLDEVTIDTNIRRIFISEFNLDKAVKEKELYELAWKVLPKGKSRTWHNALMDYGALKATSKKTGIKPQTKQSKFKGSNRWYRSKLLKKIRMQPITVEEIEEEYGKKGLKALKTLQKDKMVTISNDIILLPK